MKVRCVRLDCSREDERLALTLIQEDVRLAELAKLAKHGVLPVTFFSFKGIDVCQRLTYPLADADGDGTIMGDEEKQNNTYRLQLDVLDRWKN